MVERLEIYQRLQSKCHPTVTLEIVWIEANLTVSVRRGYCSPRQSSKNDILALAPFSQSGSEGRAAIQTRHSAVDSGGRTKRLPAINKREEGPTMTNEISQLAYLRLQVSADDGQDPHSGCMKML